MVLIHFIAGRRLDCGADPLHGREKARLVLIHFMTGRMLDCGADPLHDREKARLWC